MATVYKNISLNYEKEWRIIWFHTSSNLSTKISVLHFKAWFTRNGFLTI